VADVRSLSVYRDANLVVGNTGPAPVAARLDSAWLDSETNGPVSEIRVPAGDLWFLERIPQPAAG